MAANNKNFIVKNGLTAQGGIQSDSDVDVTGDISATGNITATGTVSGATLSGSIATSNLTGTIDSARIPALAASDITSGEFDSNRIPVLAAGDITSGTFTVGRIPSLAASKITSGTFDSARIPVLAASDITSGEFDSSRIPVLAASDITSGEFDSNRIPVLAAGDITSGTFAIGRIPEIALGTNTSGNYVQSTTAGPGIKALSAAAESVDQTISVDSSFVTGLFSGGDGITYSSGAIALDPTDSATFENITAKNKLSIFDSANGIEVAKVEGDINTGLTIHSHAHATDGGIRFIIHDTADSDYLILSQPTGISVVNRRIRNVGAPTDDLDAATKSYVDGVAQGLAVRDPAKAATVAPLTSTNDITAIAYDSGALGFGSTLTITATVGLDSVDGFTLTSGDRIIVKDETGPNLPFNGIYVWNNAKLLTRATDMDSASEFNGGEFVFVQEGTVNGGNGFSQKDNVTTLGQNPIHFVQFSGAGQITAGDGISKTGNTLDLDITSTNPGVLIDGSNQLQTKVDATTIENSANGLRVKDNGITISKLAGTEAAAAEQVTVENILENTGETLSTTALRERLEDGIYKIYTTAIGDSDTTALVDSAYVRPLARAAIVAGTDITYDSATGIISYGGITYRDVDVEAVVDSAYIRPLARAAIVAGDNVTFDSSTGIISVSGNLDSNLTQQMIDSTIDNDIVGTANEIEVTTSGGKATIGLVDAVQIATSLTVGGNSVLTTANEGSGNGIDADTVDGLEADAFLRSGATDAYTSGTLTFNSGTTLTAAAGATVNFSNTTGTAPFTVASTTVVTNLNADQLDGQHGAYYRIAIQDSTGTVLNP